MFDVNIKRMIKSIPILIDSKKKFVLGWPWGLALYTLIVGNGFPPIQPTILIILSSFFISASVYIYNDIQDVEMDRENEIKKNRPIASGKVKTEDAQILVYIFGILGLIIAWMINIYSFAMMLAFFTLFYAYSHPLTKLKYRYLGKDFTLVVGHPMLGLAANFAISNEISIILLQCTFLIALYVLTQGPLANEASDLIEDTKYGVKSISTMLSMKSKVHFMVLGLLAQLILLPTILLQYGVNFVLPIFSVVILLIVLVSSYSLLKTYNLADFSKAHRLGAVYMLVLPVLFIVISMRIPMFF